MIEHSTPTIADSSADRRGLHALLFALLLWFPVFLFEFLGLHSWNEILESAVMTRNVAVAAAVAATGAAVLSAIAVIGARKAEDEAARGVLAVVVSSALVLSMADAVHHWSPLVRRASPEVVLLGILIAAGAAGRSVAALCRLLRLLRTSAGTTVVLLVVFAAWGMMLHQRLDAFGSPLRASITLTNLAALGLALSWTRRLHPSARHIAHGLAVVGAVAVPAAIVVWGSGRLEAAPAPTLLARGATPNVVMVMIDTFRADRTGIGGYDRDTTPNLDRMARDRATWFSNAVAPTSYTVPSVKTLFTGLLPSHWGANASKAPPTGTWTLAKSFRESGYRTAAYCANGLIDAPGFRTGFQQFQSMGGLAFYRRSFLLQRMLSGGRHVETFRRVESLRLHKEEADGIDSRVRSWLGANQDHPFFLYVHFIDPHWPTYDRGYGLIPADVRDIPSPYSHADLMFLKQGSPRNAVYRDTPQYRELQGRYDEEMRFVDESLGRIADHLDALGIGDSTLVIVVGDHGEEFFEHDGYGHGHDVYEEQVHVPMLIRWPRDGSVPSMAARIDEPRSLVDVMPTLIDLLGLQPPPSPMQGESMRSLLAGKNQMPNTQPAWSVSQSGVLEGTRAFAYREGRRKVRLQYDVGPERLLWLAKQVFDLDADPLEQSPLDASEPAVSAIVDRAQRRFRNLGMAITTKGVKIETEADAVESPGSDAGPIENLRALGYLQ